MGATGPIPTDAYFAGYIDADGCIRFSGGSVRIEVGSVYPWTLLEFQDRFGGSVRKVLKDSSDRYYYRWELNGQSAKTCLEQIQHHLRVKGTQARLVLEASDNERGAWRDGLAAQASALKHANYYSPTSNDNSSDRW